MTTQEFLKANREEVVSFYNTNVQPLYAVTLKDFMVDLLNNFRKITSGEDFKKFDLMGNLQEAKSRLGLFANSTAVTYSTPYAQSNHAKAVNYFGKDKVNMISNAK